MTKIRVVYDEQIFLLQEHGGISRYFAELVKAFIANPDLGVEPVLASNSIRSEYLLEEVSSLRLTKVKSRARAYIHLLMRLASVNNKKLNGDIVHFTYYLPGFLRRFKGMPRVVTLYDMIPENTPRGKRFWNPHFSKKKYISKADLVLSISDSSTHDMHREYGFTMSVSTTYLGVGAEFQANLPRLDWQPLEYFLFVGNRATYKDCSLAIQAFSEVAKDYPNLVLQLAGGGPLTADETKLIDQLGMTNRIVQKSIGNHELPNVYANAKGLLYPSQYEGFGLPLVEAMASGTPIIASNTPINREIAAEAATYFEVGNKKSLVELMTLLTDKPEDFQSKIDKGLSRAKNFSWHNCAQRTAKEYRNLLQREREK
jgi:glycosyltransferase involved in cell wall biosynthesis